MKDIALYYPTMKVPQGSWLTQTLLYWDQVASIVPSRVQLDLQRDPFIAQLIDLGQLVMIDPAEALSEPGVEERIYHAIEELVLPSLPNGGVGPIENGGSRMRDEKMLYSIRSHFERLGFAHPTDSLEWIRIDSAVGSWYMALLAGLVAANLSAKNQDFLVRPVTSSEDDLNSLLRSPLDDAAERYLCSVVHDVLPLPETPVDPLEIVRFKESHGDELRQLRNWIDRKMLEARLQEGEVLSHWARVLRNDAAEQIDTLIEAMNRRRWPKPVLAGAGIIVSTGLSAASTFITGIDALGIGLSIGSLAASLVPASIDRAEALRGTPYDRRAPLAYAALATRRFRMAQ